MRMSDYQLGSGLSELGNKYGIPSGSGELNSDELEQARDHIRREIRKELKIKEGAENLRKASTDKKSVANVSSIIKEANSRLGELMAALNEIDSQLLMTRGGERNASLAFQGSSYGGGGYHLSASVTPSVSSSSSSASTGAAGSPHPHYHHHHHHHQHHSHAHLQGNMYNLSSSGPMSLVPGPPSIPAHGHAVSSPVTSVHVEHGAPSHPPPLPPPASLSGYDTASLNSSTGPPSSIQLGMYSDVLRFFVGKNYIVTRALFCDERRLDRNIAKERRNLS
ncbi:unnamed protein product [Darwinula stevensoni]|uniref:REM-1 domain-containing protein n=1 Tax=Darwinula stevensoni TaxID=69355 RepID=A0A7R8X443_9CRUS|nr:unnamed protein product [Darwinula stevensoni]CAG0879274.1 unnamed protein product [Darwinula stevensoni]